MKQKMKKMKKAQSSATDEQDDVSSSSSSSSEEEEDSVESEENLSVITSILLVFCNAAPRKAGYQTNPKRWFGMVLWNDGPEVYSHFELPDRIRSS